MKNVIRLLCFIVVLYLCASNAFSAEKVFFYTTDPAGSPVAITDATGNVVWRADYKPFGQEQSITGSLENNERFIGKEKDKETGLDYFGARYMYDKAGRFTSPDPVGPVESRTSKTNYEMLINPQKLNLYAYALNNPYRYADHDGKFALLLAPLAIPALEALGYSILGLATFKVFEQIYSNYTTGMYNEGTTTGEPGKPGTYAPDRPLPRDKRTGNPVSESENPHTQLGEKTSSRTGDKYTQGREFGKDGKHVRDVDFTDHGRPGDHPNPHQHRINPETGKRLGVEPLP